MRVEKEATKTERSPPATGSPACVTSPPKSSAVPTCRWHAAEVAPQPRRRQEWARGGRQQGRGRGPEAYARSLDGSGVASGAAVCACRNFRPPWVLSDGAVSRPEAGAPTFEVSRRRGEWDEHGEGQVVLVSPKVAVGGVDVDSRLALGPLQLGGHVEVSQARAALGQVGWRRHLGWGWGSSS